MVSAAASSWEVVPKCSPGAMPLVPEARADARKAKDFAEADRIRDDLLEKGIILDDSREGTTWRRSQD